MSRIGSRVRTRVTCTCTIFFLVACGTAAPGPVTVATKTQLPTMRSVAVVELGDTVFAFDRDKVTIARGGSVVGRADAPPDMHWAAGATIAAPDGNGRWVVGIAVAGAPGSASAHEDAGVPIGGSLWRIFASGEVDPVGERFGLAGARAVSIASAGTAFGIGLADGAALSRDGVHVERLRWQDAPNVAVSRGKMALWSAHGLAVVDLAKASQVSYRVAHPRAAVYVSADSDRAQLAVLSDDGLYVEDRGELHRVAVPGRIERITASADHLWILTRDAVYARTAGVLVRTSAPAGDAIFSSPSGDVWIAGASEVTRYSLDLAPDDRAWRAQIAPVFQRVCSHCHLPGGDAGVDLSTAGAWEAERAEIARRVLVTRTMPPAGTELSDDDRAALAAWLAAKP